jgi:hypothetical protein
MASSRLLSSTLAVGLSTSSLLAGARTAAADPFREGDTDTNPIVAEGTVGLSVLPLGPTTSLGMHGWIGRRILVEGRAIAAVRGVTRDLDGDGRDDFDTWNGTGDESDISIEAQGQVGYPLLWKRRSFAAYFQHQGLRKVVKSGASETVEDPAATVTYTEVSDLSAVAGARVALFGDETQAAIAIGLRASDRRETRSSYFRERWAQARLLVFPATGQVGADAELAILPWSFGASIYAEYVPQLNDRAMPVCSEVPEECTTGYPLTALNPIPNDSYLGVGLRLHYHFPF